MLLFVLTYDPDSFLANGLGQIGDNRPQCTAPCILIAVRLVRLAPVGSQAQGLTPDCLGLKCLDIISNGQRTFRLENSLGSDKIFTLTGGI